MLFNVCMKLLGEVIQRFGMCCHPCAHDTQLYMKHLANPREAVGILNGVLDAIWERMWTVKVESNPNKTEVLLVSGKSALEFKMLPILDGLHSP